MTRPRRPSAQTTAVVLALAQDPATWHYGYQLCQHLGLKAGSVYPILMRLADRGLLETAWERDAPAGRPPRHLYRLTGPGRVLAGGLAAEPAGQPTGGRSGGDLSPAGILRVMSAIWMAVFGTPWVIAAQLLWRTWWRGAGAGLAVLDGPAQLLAVATATLPADRRDWGRP